VRPSFNQLAWLDERTTSGSWGLAKDSPNRPARTCKTVVGATVHWGPAARASRTGSSGPAPSTGRSMAPACSTGRSACRTWSPTTRRPRTGWASRARTGSRPGRPTITSR
jgi:hypothetical protein